MTSPIDPQDQQPMPNHSGAGRLDDPAAQEDRGPLTDPTTSYPSASEPVDQPSRHPAPGLDDRGRVKSGRISAVWVGLIATALFVVLLVIFIAQNSHKVPLHFFGWHGQFSLALTILLSAVIGMLLVAIPGSIRIAQLRHSLRKNDPGRRV